MTRGCAVAIVAGTVGVVMFLCLAFEHRYMGVRVRVENVGDVPVRDVVVCVTGQEVLLGELGPGEARKVRVAPRGESHVEVRHRTSSDGTVTRVIDTYFESHGYRGTVDVRMTEDGVESVDDGVTIGLF